VSFDWELAAGRRSKVPLILAGGLRPENVAEAISVVRPFAVDVASGVESGPGVKDPALLEALFEAVRGEVPTGA
jgi:phosphoribosylanthranilate isomerase